ncbi:unnamed protein product [Peronospora belbahrii]|uniref:Uncharacterized protein n=1 Tax=Peronospora belbahrii TaxID=622444 RepID=A0AAU9KWD9_9STRA|nr:unnamed protein product [Peronospora belbahrii]
MEISMHAINESSLLMGNATGDGEFIGLSLNWVETHRTVSLVTACTCCILATLLSVYNILQHLTHYSRPQLQRYIVRILVIVPVYAIGSFLSLTFVNQALYFDSIRDCYEAFVVYSFLALVLSFAGGESVCVLKIQSEPDIRHPWPFNRCFDPLGRDGRLLRLCKRATIQFIFVKPIFAALSLLMMACGKYHTLIYQLILVIVYNISYSVALYGLWIFFLATKHMMEPFNPMLKFFAVKGVVFLTYWQNSLLDFIPGITNEQTFAWKDFILCIEMVLFAVVHLVAFNSSQFKRNLDRLPDSEVLNNMKEVLSLTDILADAYHNFMPSYRDYMLQRGSESTGRARKKNLSTGFSHTSSSSSCEENPTPMAHSNPRVPRFVIDDEDDEEMDESNLRSSVNTLATTLSEQSASLKGKLSKLTLSMKEIEGDTDMTMANPQDDDQIKNGDTKKDSVEITIHDEQIQETEDTISIRPSSRQRSNSSPLASNIHDGCTHYDEEKETTL